MYIILIIGRDSVLVIIDQKSSMLVMVKKDEKRIKAMAIDGRRQQN